MSVASTFERQMLDLINAERAARGIDPLTLELRLNAASEEHSAWMDDTLRFGHTGAGGSDPGDRMRDAGFTFSGSWSWGENIAYQSERGAPGIADDVADLHAALMNSPGHRANILDPGFDLIGIGIEVGDNRGFDAVYVTQKFARTSAPVQVDEAAAADTPITGTDGADRLAGTDAADTMIGGRGRDTLSGGSGDDLIRGGGGSDRLQGGAGDDRLLASNGADTLEGGAGRDLLKGGKANDVLRGGGGNDRLAGGAGDDTLTGGADGDKFVFGIGRDVITDFNVNTARERIDLRGFDGADGFQELVADGHLRQTGNGALIEDTSGNTMLVQGVSASALDASDFLF